MGKKFESKPLLLGLRCGIDDKPYYNLERPGGSTLAPGMWGEDFRRAFPGVAAELRRRAGKKAKDCRVRMTIEFLD